MTENRKFAVWLRTLVGLVALAGLLGLSGCGGGSGAPNNVFDTPGPLTLVPESLTVYSETPATLTVAGGQPPYTIFSADQSILPVQTDVIGSTVNLLPNVVSAATSVTVTARDARGVSTQTDISIKPAPLINTLKLKADSYIDACPNSGGSAAPGDDQTSTFICSGQTGTVSVQIANTVGGGIAGRQVRFDIVQGAFQIFTELPGKPPSFALTYTVTTDQNGNAVARIRADPGASQQIVVVKATDVSTGAYVRGTFVIVSVVNANAADLVVVPTTVTISGPDNETCSSGVSSTYYIFGGQPPYRVVASFPQALTISPSEVQSYGAGFTATTTGACVDPETIAITDAALHTVTVTLTNKPGSTAPGSFTKSVPIVLTPSSIPDTDNTRVTCGTSTTVIATGGGSITTTGNTQTYNAPTFQWSTSRPDILSVLPSSADSGVAATLTRIVPPAPTGVAVGSTATNQVTPPLYVIQPPAATLAGGNATVTVSVSDGTQIKKLTVPVTNDCTGPPTPAT